MNLISYSLCSFVATATNLLLSFSFLALGIMMCVTQLFKTPVIYSFHFVCTCNGWSHSTVSRGYWLVMFVHPCMIIFFSYTVFHGSCCFVCVVTAFQDSFELFMSECIYSQVSKAL